MTSTPPSSRPSICSRNAARTSASGDVRSASCRRTQRSDRTADQGVPPADLAGLAGELGRSPVEPPDLGLEAPGRESHPVRAERQRLDQLGARLDVLAMGSPDQLGMGRDQLFEAGALGHAAAEQERAHPAVDQERASGQAVAETLARRGRRIRWLGHRSPVDVRLVIGTGIERPFLPGRVSREFPYRAGWPARNWHLADPLSVGCRGFNGPVPPPLLIRNSSVVGIFAPCRPGSASAGRRAVRPPRRCSQPFEVSPTASAPWRRRR